MTTNKDSRQQEGSTNHNDKVLKSIISSVITDTRAAAVAEPTIEPFEWLTNFSSLAHLLQKSYLFPDISPSSPSSSSSSLTKKSKSNNGEITKRRTALHIGCGSSTLGECLVRRLDYDLVVNADVDRDTLEMMRKRWENKIRSDRGSKWEGRVHWEYLDFKQDHHHHHHHHHPILQPPQHYCKEHVHQQKRCCYDLVLDKSTLDCALCSDEAATGLIHLVHSSLSPDGGVYFVVSFHPADFVMPLLRDCPGVDWTVEHLVVKRSVDLPERCSLLWNRNDGDGDCDGDDGDYKDTVETVDFGANNAQGDDSAWSSGTFLPGAEYGKTVNVFLCRRHCHHRQDYGIDGRDSDNHLDRDAVREHVHRTNDQWFQKHNPMMTHTREKELRRLFSEQLRLQFVENEKGDGTDDEDECRNGDICNIQYESGCSSSSEKIDDEDCYYDDKLWLQRLQHMKLPLHKCYEILFTNAEREHLPYDHFLEDWEAFVAEHAEDDTFSSLQATTTAEREGMTFATAVRFLTAMQ